MIPLLHDLIAALSQDVSLDEIVAHLGPIASDPGALSVPASAELTPRDPAFRKISVGRYPDDGKPYTLTLELAAPLAVAALTAAFGSYRQVHTDRGRPRTLAFPPAGGPWTIVLHASVPAGTSPLDEAETSRLVLRRDPP